LRPVGRILADEIIGGARQNPPGHADEDAIGPNAVGAPQ